MTKRKIRVPRTRNNGTMTEAAFWSWIRSALRQKSRWWKPVSEARKKAKRKYNGTNKRQKWEYKCADCKKYYKATDVQVDHIIPAGKLKSSSDLKGFVDRLFCEVDGLQVLCTTCHDIKTKKERKQKKK